MLVLFSCTMFAQSDTLTIYHFQAKNIDGEEVQLSAYRGQVLLIVNVASRCGYTPQYKGLQSLYEKYRNRKFSVLGFPCNQFGGQEPGTESEIKIFCDSLYKVTFPLFSKIEVNGPQAHPLFEFLKKDKPGIAGSAGVKWNFTKFLIDHQGKPVKRYAPGDKPEEIDQDIEKLLRL